MIQPDAAALNETSRAKLRRAAVLLAVTAGLRLFEWVLFTFTFRLPAASIKWVFAITEWFPIAIIVLEAVAIVPLVKPGVDPSLKAVPSKLARAAMIALVARWALVVFVQLHASFGAAVSPGSMKVVYLLMQAVNAVAVIAVMLCAGRVARAAGAKSVTGFVPVAAIAAGCFYGYRLFQIFAPTTPLPPTLRYVVVFYAVTSLILWARFHKINFDARPDDDADFDDRMDDLPLDDSRFNRTR